MQRANILVVEDESIVALGIEEQLNKLGHEVVGVAERADQAVDLAGTFHPDLVLMDIRLKGSRDGIEAAREIRNRFDIPVVYLTAYGDEATLRRAENSDAFGYLIKPCRESDLRATVATALHRHEIEQRLRESELRYRTTIDAVDFGLIATDETGTIRFVNPAAERMAMRPASEVLRRPVEQMFPLVDERTNEPAAHPVLQSLKDVSPHSLSDVLLKREGADPLPVAAEAVPIASPGSNGAQGVVCTLRDLTQSRREAEQMQYLQKMEGLALIAAGIAHDFNNLLTPIVGFIDMAISEVPQDSAAVTLLRESLKAARRAADLTMQLLAYSGKARVNTGSTNLSEIVQEMQALLQASVSKKAVLRYQLPRLPSIQADPTQVRQVVLNLVINASEALEGKTGEIRIRTGEETIAEPQSVVPQAPPDIPPGPFVFIEVSDTGSGMDEATLARIFDPFYTTKFFGRGLGLAAVQGVAKGHRGTIHVSSRPGEGTTFRVSFPKTTPTGEALAQPGKGATTSTGRGTVLVVEDEEAVRFMVQTILERKGWTVIPAADGEQALDQFARHSTEVSLILLDLTMPRLSGKDVVSKLQAAGARTPILVMSGYSSEEIAEGFPKEQVRGFVQKPFSPGELLAAVDSAVSQETPS